MARYATGKKSKAISDISGFKIPYSRLKTTWDNLRVEPEEFDVKHPQLTPAKNVVDATALFNPRPDTDKEITNVVIGYNYDIFSGKLNRPNVGVVAVGGVGRLNTAPSGDRATSAIGFESAIVETGLAGTFSIGTYIIDQEIGETGLEASGAIGSFTIECSITETGLAGTTAIGTFVEEASITEAGLEGTGETGTETPVVSGWGQEGWGERTWGL
jgi:hypothetical protein